MNKRHAAAVLRRAAKVVDAGWHQGWFSDFRGNYCAIGAINRAQSLPAGSVEGVGDYDLAAEALHQDLSDDGHQSIASWNDEPGRTAKQVASRMRKVARKLEHGMVVRPS